MALDHRPVAWRSTWATAGWTPIHPEDRERVERDWRDCVRTGKVFDGRYRVRTKTGSYRHYDVRAVPIERDGKIIEWVGASTDVTGQREAEEMRGRLTEQLSAAALRTARLQQATSMLAEALTVQQVVEVITEVGRSAIGADRVGGRDAGPRAAAGCASINPTGLPDGPGAPAGEIPLDVPSVMTAAIATRAAGADREPGGAAPALRRPSETSELFLAHSDERAWVGLPLLAAGAPLGALRFSFTRPRQITDEERVFLEALAGQCALAAGAGLAVRARAHHRRDAAAQPAAGPAAQRAGHRPGGQVPAGHPEHGDRRRLVRRVPAARRQAGGRGRATSWARA